MKRVRDFEILSGLVAVAILLPGCPPSLGDRCDEGACLPGGSSGDGGGDGRDADVPDAPIPPDCKEDADANAPEAKGCMVDTFAVFVDGATGDDANPGTKEKPFKKIATAIAQGPANGKRRIYVCGPGPYPEHLKLTTAVHLFGGFACDTWLPDATIKAKVAPTDAGYALHVDNVNAPIRFEDVAFEAVAGTAGPNSRSSIAVFVSESSDVLFKRASMVARAGFRGGDGEDGVQGTSDPVDRSGNNGSDTGGGAAKVCLCSTGGSSTGGRGGDTNGTDIDGKQGQPVITPPSDVNFTGAGQTQSQCNASGAPAKRGSDAPKGADASKPNIGALTKDGWAPGDGKRGENGSPGQGGGGGGSLTNGGAGVNGGGGGGACGGCGGSGGGGGSAGGASVAVLAFNARMKLSGCTLESSNAGAGGLGKEGGSGTGSGGVGDGGNSACNGALGGNGGKGGSGAGGAGGVSAAVLYAGDAPVNDASTVKFGSKGSGGAGGNAPENDGPDGLEGEIVPAP